MSFEAAQVPPHLAARDNVGISRQKALQQGRTATAISTDIDKLGQSALCLRRGLLIMTSVMLPEVGRGIIKLILDKGAMYPITLTMTADQVATDACLKDFGWLALRGRPKLQLTRTSFPLQHTLLRSSRTNGWTLHDQELVLVTGDGARGAGVIGGDGGGLRYLLKICLMVFAAGSEQLDCAV